MTLVISKLSQQSQQAILKLNGSGLSRSTKASIALAWILANNISIPVEQLDPELIESYWRTTHKFLIIRQLGDINEAVTINIDEALDLVYKFYSFRVATATTKLKLPFLNEHNAIGDLLGITSSIPLDVLNLIVSARQEINLLLNWFYNIVTSILEIPTDDPQPEPLNAAAIGY
jgi:hypothetical protein